jgi:hypothetical protein
MRWRVCCSQLLLSAQSYLQPVKSSSHFSSWVLIQFCDDHYSVFFLLDPIELSWSAEILQLLWTCCSETSCLHEEPKLTDLILVVDYASREGGALISPTVAGQTYASEGRWDCCCCWVLLHSTTAKDSPGVAWLEENTLPVVVMGDLCNFLCPPTFSCSMSVSML